MRYIEEQVQKLGEQYKTYIILLNKVMHLKKRKVSLFECFILGSKEE
jgi:hypothetical protein